MKLGEFIKNFSHNNIIRLVYKTPSGHETVSDSWYDVSMDWEVNKAQGKFRHYINNEVLGIASIMTDKNSGALNIVIEKLENQPFVDEKKVDESKYGISANLPPNTNKQIIK